jgi:hypothetical protein|tara:strand:- start:193 stop:504 length:312 start_codon:yes stop_codon:yes gene_type:complete
MVSKSNIYPLNIEEWPKHMLVGTTKNICDAITKHNLWNWMKNESPPEDKGYSYWNHSNILLIENEENVIADHHSGGSWACSMRGAQMIAIKGFESYCKQFNKK